MNFWYAASALGFLILIAATGTGILHWKWLFGVVIPYAAFATFVVGIIVRVVRWARSPVPFRIPTSCGQQKTLPWIKSSRLDNPHNVWGAIGRMILEVLFFRSLFRNTSAQFVGEGSKSRLVYGADKYLWAGALVFHWTLLIIVLRHIRFFVEPVPAVIGMVEALDSFFQFGLPLVYLTGIGCFAAVSYLLLRRLLTTHVRYISLASDYFPILLILVIVVTGGLLRYTSLRVDIVAVKELAAGLAGFTPTVPDGINWLFYTHLFLVSILLAYFPFSKLVHAPGVFLSPTRNLANNSRRVRHINPWNYPVKTHTYEEWEEEFYEKIKNSGLPVERVIVEETAEGGDRQP